MSGPIAIVLKGYPRLAETFIAQELRALERRGLDLRIYSLRRPYDPATHPIHAEIKAPVVYLPEYLKDDPRRVFAGWRRARRLPGFGSAFRLLCADLARDPSPNRLRRFGQACVLAGEMPPETRKLHAHFLHTPSSVARYAAVMRGLSWSASAHAKDVWTTPAWDLRAKLAAAAWVTTCTRAAAEHLRELTPARDKVQLTYHGLDLARFPPMTGARSTRDGAGAPVELLSVGRLVDKKGYDVLLPALALLPKDLAWRLTHIGGGERAAEIKALAERLGLGGRIIWRGAQPQTEVLAALRAADLFVLACKISDDRDRDGLPNVLMEAQSQSLACLATRVSGIPELIEDGASGRLVAAKDPAAFADALAALIRDPGMRARLGAAGCARLRAAFDFEAGVDAIAQRLTASV